MQFAKSHKYKKGKDLGREKCKKVKSSRTYFCMLMDHNVAKPFVKSHDVYKHDATSRDTWNFKKKCNAQVVEIAKLKYEKLISN